MTKEETFQVWAPDDCPWSPWVKPVLFAHLGLADESIDIAAPETSWAPAVSDRIALVVNLPGPEGVLMGTALAGRGYRPVPLYNALPLPWGEASHYPSPGKAVAAVNILPILHALASGTQALADANLPCDAPPAFLLDYNRQGEGRKPGPGQFDNRSTFPGHRGMASCFNVCCGSSDFAARASANSAGGFPIRPAGVRWRISSGPRSTNASWTVAKT